MISLDASQIATILSKEEVIQAVRAGSVKCALDEYEVPDRLHLGDNACTYLVMPAMGTDYYCTKLVSVVPANVHKGLPVVLGDVVLNDRSTGRTVAILDAAAVTAIRTAAVGAIGLDLIAGLDVSVIGVIGCGVQGVHQTIFASAVRNISTVYVTARTKDRFEGYKKKVLEQCPHVRIEWLNKADEVVEHSEVVYTCTNAPSPVFSNHQELIEGKRFISVGSFRTGMQELPDDVYKMADKVIIDSPLAKTEVGDIINTLDNNWKAPDEIVLMGDVLVNEKLIAKNTENIVFKSVGMAAFDLAVAVAIYENCTNGNLKIDDFNDGV